MRPRLLVSVGEDGPDWSISGSPAMLAAHFEELIEAGVDGMAISLENALADFGASLRVFTSEVLSKIATR